MRMIYVVKSGEKGNSSIASPSIYNILLQLQEKMNKNKQQCINLTNLKYP